MICELKSNIPSQPVLQASPLSSFALPAIPGCCEWIWTVHSPQQCISCVVSTKCVYGTRQSDSSKDGYIGEDDFLKCLVHALAVEAEGFRN